MRLIALFAGIVLAGAFLGDTAKASCLIIGDSIGQDLSYSMRECRSTAIKNKSSAATVYTVAPADVLIVSAGSNDWESPLLLANLKAIRAKASGRVIWVEPSRICCRVAADAVDTVAALHGDPVVPFASGRDGAHPVDNNKLAAAVRAQMRW